jgi:mono/diheme cytochrome c family protein
LIPGRVGTRAGVAFVAGAAAVACFAWAGLGRGAPEPAPAPRTPGEAIFRLGMLPSGKPVRAMVSGDVPLEGAGAACQTCHRRSGMGTVEGRTWTPPIVGRTLFASRGSGARMRPPYDDETLARALRKGLDAAGRPLDPIMPRYDFAAQDLAALKAYLLDLSRTPSPGVTDTEIRFATVVTPDADPAVVDAMQGVFKAYFATQNVRTRHLGKWDQYNRNYRKWKLETWSVAGPPATWRDQLEEKYAKGPVFALLSGAGGTEWGPVHEFCERNEIPCVLPNIDVPPAMAGTGHYSVYFTRGVVLEAETIASAIADAPGDARVVQFCPPSGPGRAGADALRKALSSRNGIEVVDAGAEMKSGPQAAAPATQVAVLWLPSGSLPSAFSGRPEGGKWSRVFVSSTLLRGEPPAVSPLRGVPAELVHPFSLPSEVASRWARVGMWLRMRGVPPGDRLTQDRTFAVCQIAGDALMHMNDEFNRDYFLELIDHVGTTAPISAFHSRISSGPGQRVLSRGCYLVPLGEPGGPARWVNP